VRLGAVARTLRVMSFHFRNSGETLNIRLVSSKLPAPVLAQRTSQLRDQNCWRPAPGRRIPASGWSPVQSQKNCRWREPNCISVGNIYFAAVLAVPHFLLPSWWEEARYRTPRTHQPPT